MSCSNELFDKYPYVYSCCEDNIDGITVEYLQDLWKKIPDLDGRHIPCVVCGKVYHIYKLGMKWTEQMITEEEKIKFRKIKQEALLEEPKDIEVPELIQFTMSELSFFKCKICGKGAFESQDYEKKEGYLFGINKLMEQFPPIILKLMTKEKFAESLSYLHDNSCESCHGVAKNESKKAKYN